MIPQFGLPDINNKYCYFFLKVYPKSTFRNWNKEAFSYSKQFLTPLIYLQYLYRVERLERDGVFAFVQSLRKNRKNSSGNSRQGFGAAPKKEPSRKYSSFKRERSHAPSSRAPLRNQYQQQQQQQQQHYYHEQLPTGITKIVSTNKTRLQRLS